MDADLTVADSNLQQGYPKWAEDEEKQKALKASLLEVRRRLRERQNGDVNALMEQQGGPVLDLKRYLDPFPFSQYLKKVWINDDRYLEHGPKVLTAMNDLLLEPPQLSQVLRGNKTDRQQRRLTKAVGDAKDHISGLDIGGEGGKVARLLRIAALYHDIGKYIIPERHPIIGWHILEYMDSKEKNKLREFSGGEEAFRLLMIVLRDHDQFGVISTGEASIPILLGAANSAHGLGVQVISALMLCNLADMAGVAKLNLDGEASDRLLDDWRWFLGALDYCASARTYLDEYVIREASRTRSDRTQVQSWEAKLIESNELLSVPSVCERIRRLLMESSRDDPSGDQSEKNWPERRRRLSDPQVVFQKLQTVFGSDNTVREFALQFTHVCKLDYGKRFFRVLIDSCEWPDRYDQPNSDDKATRSANKAVYATYAILKRITTTYANMMGIRGTRGNLIGVELKDLAPDAAPEKAARIADLILADHYPGLTWMISDTPAWYF